MTRPAGNGSAGRVLVVEDDEGIREMLKYNLSSAGFSVQEASDGAAGLRTARTARPDRTVSPTTISLLGVRIGLLTGVSSQPRRRGCRGGLQCELVRRAAQWRLRRRERNRWTAARSVG